MSTTFIRRLLAATLALAAAAPVAAQTGPAGTVRYYHADALGSVRAVTDAQGNVVARHDYFAFGEEPAGAPNPAKPRFTGQERDPETGMDYFGARYYVQRLGRFTTSDPEHVGGNTSDPQSWNAYAYARNNPLRFIDPTGTDYLVAIDGGSSFWFEGGPINEFGQLKAFAAGFTLDGGMFGGTIYSAAGVKVGTYTYAEKMVHLASDISSRTAAVANAVGVAVTATQFALSVTNPVASTIGTCLTGSCSAGGAALAAVPGVGRAAPALTRWGWAGGRKFNAAVGTLKNPGTHDGLAGIIPTLDEAMALIRKAGGRIDRIEGPHAVGGVSTHTYPHINYTTASGAKATVRIQ